jgi:hypothetical protein
LECIASSRTRPYHFSPILACAWVVAKMRSIFKTAILPLEKEKPGRRQVHVLCCGDIDFSRILYCQF